jgi:hypothetical protein
MQKFVKVAALAPQMVLGRCVTDSNGKIVLADGTVVTEKIIHRLQLWDIDEVCITCQSNEEEENKFINHA